MAKRLVLGRPSKKQALFLNDSHKIVGYGGARGGGKSWAVRTKAKIMALSYPGIRIAIVRRSYPELRNNHINNLKKELNGIGEYNEGQKVFTFGNGSMIQFIYCAKDKDLDNIQGVEFDLIFIDEAAQLSEYQIKVILACLRGANEFPKRMYMTCNPGGKGHGYVKRIFIDRNYEPGENPDDYSFIQSLVDDNTVLMQTQPDYKKNLELLPAKLRKAWLEGSWDIYEGQFFEEFVVGDEEQQALRQWTHVIEPFPIPRDWPIYRSYDFGYAKPFSCGWWTVDYMGTVYRILELYGCTGTPNEGVKWTPDEQFRKIHEIETTHPWLVGREIQGVADPSIWDKSRGISVAETAMKHGVYFVPGDNARIPGWMQIRYRMQFNKDGEPKLYVFNTCKGFIRTMPILCFSETNPEDLDTSGEDHIADETRYFCMQHIITPQIYSETAQKAAVDPLDLLNKSKQSNIRRI